MKYSLVIPCYNEARALPALAERCRGVLTALPGSEIVLVDNGSTDGSPEILPSLAADTPGLRSLRVAVNQGYGHGILAGLGATTGDVLGWTHADLQTDPMDTVKGFALFARAERPERLYVKGRRYGRPLADRVFTAGMSTFETLLLGTRLTDINAQPNLFHRAFFETWRGAPTDFSLDLFAYYTARRDGLRIKRIPVAFGERAFGVSHWNVDWRGKMKFIRRTVTFSLSLKSGLRSGRTS